MPPPPIKMLSCSPVLKLAYSTDISMEVNVFGSSRAINVLDHFLGTPDIATQVLFLGSGDLRNALYMATQCSDAYHELDIHLSDGCDTITARNFLIAHVMLSDSFEPSSPSDMQYLWDLWYGFQWDEATRKRFVKDVKPLVENQQTNSSVIPHGVKFGQKLSKIYKSWLGTACNMNSKQLHSILEQRHQFILDSCAISLMGMEKFSESKEKNPSVNLVDYKEMAKAQAPLMGIDVDSSPLSINVMNEIEFFLETGDLEPKKDKIICVNLTLLTLDDTFWEISSSICPFDAYFPLPLVDKLEEKLCLSAYKFCRSKLQSLVTELRLRRERNRFHFYFGDSLDLCLTDQELHNKMHVIHCSCDLVRHINVANILPVVSACLNGDMKEAVLVTEISFLQHSPHTTLVGYVEDQLCCQLTMIPTMYGVRLLDHVRLGSYVCFQFHDLLKLETSIALKWCKAPIAYSTDVRLDVSPALVNVANDLVKTCFTMATSFYSPKEPNSSRTLFVRHYQHVRNSPFTFYYIFQSLLNRYNWTQNVMDSFITHCLPVPFHLTWRTVHDWMNGKRVLLVYNNSIEMRDAILSDQTEPFKSTLVQLVLKQIGHEKNYRRGQVVGEEFFSDVHHIFNLNWKDSNIDEFVVSFLLAKDHGLESSTHLFILNVCGQILYSTSLTSQSMLRKVVINPNPSRRVIFPSIPSNPLFDLRCQESEEEYKLDVSLCENSFQSLRDFSVLIEPAYSTHYLKLYLTTATSVV